MKLKPTTLEDINKLKGIDRLKALNQYHRGIKEIRKEDWKIERNKDMKIRAFKQRKMRIADKLKVKDFGYSL